MIRHFVEAFGRSRELIAHKFAAGNHIVTLTTDGIVQDVPSSSAETVLVFENWTVTLPTTRGAIPAEIAPDERVGHGAIFSGRRPRTVVFRDGTRMDLPIWLMPHDEQRREAVKAIQLLVAYPGMAARARQTVAVNGRKEPVFCSWATSLGKDAVLYCIETHERRYSLAVTATSGDCPGRLAEIWADGHVTLTNAQTRAAHPRGKPATVDLPTDLQALRARQWQLERRRTTPAAGRIRSFSVRRWTI